MTLAFWLADWPVVVAQQTADEFSRSMARHHAMSSAHSALEVAVVVVGVIVVVATTACAVRYVVRPGEVDAGHIKRRILDEDQPEQP